MVVGVLAVGCQAGDGLSTTTQDSVVLSPGSHDFGSLQVGTSATFALSINPAANANDDVVTAITASCPDFSVDAPGLPAEVYRTCDTITCAVPCSAAFLGCTTVAYVNYTFNATYQPVVAGVTSCVVDITLNGATHRTLTLSGTGTVPPVAIDVQPIAIDFGEVRRNTDSSPVSVVVRSAGGATLNVSSVTVTSGFQIASGTTTGIAIAPGNTEVYGVVCHPTTTVPQSGMLSIASDDPNRSTLTVALDCKGIDSTLSVSPSPTMLPTTRVGEPVSTTITIGNTGMAGLMLDNLALSGAGLTLTAPATPLAIVPGGSVQVTVGFAALTGGDTAGSLVATFDGGQTQATQISARAVDTSMALTPDGLVDFGPVCAGQSKARAFTILGNSAGSFVVETVSDPSPPFTLAAVALPASIAGSGGNSLVFSVTAAPTAAGHATSELTIATDIPNAMPRTIALSVDALPAGVTPTPDALDFGSNPIESTTIGQSVHVSNCSSATIGWSNARIEGMDATEFAIVSTPAAATIPSSGFASWLVVLQAHTVGPKQAIFAVDHDGGTTMVALAGEGLGAPPDPGTTPTAGEKSYYSCSSSDARTGAPLAIGLLLLLRRRRRLG